MSKINSKPKIIERFIKIYLKKFEKPPDTTRLITNMIVDGIIDPERLRNFMIINDFYENLRKYDGHVTNSTMITADEYDLSDRQIQNIIYKWSPKFRARKRQMIKDLRS